MHPLARMLNLGRLGTRGRAVVLDEFPDVIAYALETAGFEVSSHEDELELLEVLRMVPPGYFELVVTDQRMPGLRGVDAIARPTRFVILTGDDTSEAREAAVRYGADGFLPRPFDVSSFFAMVDAMTRKEPLPTEEASDAAPGHVSGVTSIARTRQYDEVAIARAHG